jgi:hypothetical protein
VGRTGPFGFVSLDDTTWKASQIRNPYGGVSLASSLESRFSLTLARTGRSKIQSPVARALDETFIVNSNLDTYSGRLIYCYNTLCAKQLHEVSSFLGTFSNFLTRRSRQVARSVAFLFTVSMW